jgi:hypothetical protein
VRVELLTGPAGQNPCGASDGPGLTPLAAAWQAHGGTVLGSPVAAA